MKTLINRLNVCPLITLGVAAFISGCASTKSGETTVSLAEMSEPARATATREIRGGTVDKITREVEHGKTVYDLEATVGGRHLEFLIDAADGKILGTEVPIEFGQLPEPVRAAAQKYFDATSGLTIMKGVEYGETHFEIEGPRKGKRVEATFNPDGKKTS